MFPMKLENVTVRCRTFGGVLIDEREVHTRKGLDVRSNIRVRWSTSNLKAVDAVLVNCPERFSWQSEV